MQAIKRLSYGLGVLLVCGLGACKPWQKKEMKKVQKKVQRGLEKASKSVRLGRFTMPEKVDPSTLEITDLEIEARQRGDHTGLWIFFSNNGLVDYYEYQLCPLQGGACTRNGDGRFGVPPHEIGDPPAGGLSVQVRACVRQKRILGDPKVACGAYAKAYYDQVENAQDEVSRALVGIEEKRSVFRLHAERLQSILAGTESRLGLAETKNEQEENLQSALSSPQALSADLLGAIMAGGIYAENELAVLGYLADAKGLELAGNDQAKGELLGAAVLLSLASPGVLFPPPLQNPRSVLGWRANGRHLRLRQIV